MMDDLIQGLVHDVAYLQAQVEWLTFLVRTSVIASLASGALSGISILTQIRNKK